MKKLFTLFLILFLFLKAFAQNKQANDCVNYIQVCDNSNITLNPFGIGDLQEITLDNACFSNEHNSLWLKIDIKTSGTLGFELIPSNSDIQVDYDFWVFGPDATCGNIGSSIRCSTTNPKAAKLSDNHTGLRDSEPTGDFYEGPGVKGDDWIKSLDVKAGESYFIVIDRPVGEDGFTLNWTGTATLQNPFENKIFNTIVDDVIVCNENSVFDFSTLSSKILNSNIDFSIIYYSNYDDANYKQNEITSPYNIKTQKYYYRIQSEKSECYKVGEINVVSQPLILDKPTLTVCQTNNLGTFNLNIAQFTQEPIDKVRFYETAFLAQNETANTEIQTPQNYQSGEKKIFAVVTTKAGCKAITELNLKFFSNFNFDKTKNKFKNCDEKLSGTISIKFSDITSQISSDLKGFTLEYYSDPAHLHLLPNDWSYSQNTTVFVKAISPTGCAPVFSEIFFEVGDRINLIKNTFTADICDNELDGRVTVELNDYIPQFTTDNKVNFQFFTSDSDARNNVNPISSAQNISLNKTFFIRFEDTTECPQIAELNFNFKQPKTSSLLNDVKICPQSSIILDAGFGFDGFLWNTGETTQSITATIGDYYVDLFSNGCVYRQNIKISAAEIQKITSILVSGNTATINVFGGTPPYFYSIDGVHYQNSNIFTNVPRGIHTAFVKSIDNCEIVTKEFVIINLVNIITPNGDGQNDVLDYSDLKIKNDVSIEIFDRSGRLVFKNLDKNYIWDGKSNGRNLPTGNYWYVLKWIEPDTQVPVIYNNWVLLKNR
ncbi:T9SS type B sorting domain-containing protein [Halpernia sp.]|uniref:T9SS type B sorting domain-containing protein n=1 Tax=Halpernia sp. TaxID=2782209 RepID=UPI003A903224